MCGCRSVRSTQSVSITLLVKWLYRFFDSHFIYFLNISLYNVLRIKNNITSLVHKKVMLLFLCIFLKNMLYIILFITYKMDL